MIYASLVAKAEKNILFEPGTGPNGGEYFVPWKMLREEFAKLGVELNTSDVNNDKRRKVSFELHHNAQRKLADIPSYAYLYEDPLVRPINGDAQHLRRYQRVFTSNENLVDNQHTLRLAYPNSLNVESVLGFDQRDLFCVMIASNKALLHEDGRGLHAARVAAIRFFESTAPALFSLYGRGWDKPAVLPGSLGRIKKRLYEWQSVWMPGTVEKNPFPSFRGSVDHKSEVLERTKFSICYENSRGAPGYVTEKIFDCLRSGTVPVYIGNMGRVNVIPESAFINRDHFSSDAELLSFLQSVTAIQYANFQKAAQDYLNSDAAKAFSNENFCAVLTQEITSHWKSLQA
jgi:alpha(1,3/1,4) fucosyltransferase